MRPCPDGAHVGDAQRPIDGLAGQEDGPRAAGEDRPLVLDGVPLLDERAHEAACRFAVRAVEVLHHCERVNDAAMQGDKREPFGLAAGPAEGRELGGAVLQRRDGGRARGSSRPGPGSLVILSPARDRRAGR